MQGQSMHRTDTMVCLLIICCASSAYPEPACKAGEHFDAVDISYHVNDKFLKDVKSMGVSTVIRYYDWKDETLPGKTLTAVELGLIAKNMLNVAVIFQHHNDRTETF